jgi:LAO/AO transport system kinase
MSDIARELLGGGVAAGARAIRWLDDGDPRGRTVLREIFPHTGRAHLVGITGPPGAGKSTLVGALIAEVCANAWVSSP